MKILFYTEISPFPVNGGERIRSYGLLKALSDLGHSVKAVISNEDKISFDDYQINNVEFIEFKSEKKLWWQNISLCYYFQQDKKLIKIFKKIIGENKIDIAFLDYSFIGQYVNFFHKNKLPVIYGTHNYQSYLTQQRPVEGILKKIRKWQSVKIQKLHEHIYFPKAEKLIVVSEKDKEFHSKFVDSNNIHVIPNFLNTRFYQRKFRKENYFVMTANFSAYMNLYGLKWIVDQVWSNELDKKYSLLIVGKNSKKALRSIQETKKFKNIIAIGMVDDITSYIGKAKAVLIPLFHGSGTRLKCIEAMALKTPIISTSIGAEGIDSEHIIIKDSADDFRKALLKFEETMVSTEKLYDDFYNKYSIDAIKPKLKQLISSIRTES